QERRDPDDVEGGEDRVQNQRSQSGADDASAAAEDRDAADHDSGDHAQLVAGPGGRVERPVLGGPEHAGDTGERAADDEGSEDPASRPDPDKSRGLRVRPDRIQVTSRAERTHVARTRAGDGPYH